MKKITLAVMLVLSHSILAQTPEECESKISEILSQVKTQDIRVPALNEEGIAPADARIDTYHMSSDLSCGVELVKDSGLLTVTKFKGSPSVEAGIPLREVVKFESLVLGSDPSRSQGRIKAKVSCSITEVSVTYTTKTPVLTDGVRSPWAIEELQISLKDNRAHFSLRASVTPIHGVFRSITDCSL